MKWLFDDMFAGKLKIIHEDVDFLTVNKPSGLLSEGGFPREEDVETIVSERLRKEIRVCHRLDRLTSGVLLLRKNGRFNKEIAALFQSRGLRKEYWALVEGKWPKGTSRVESLIDRVEGGRWANVDSGGKSAVSTFQVLGYDAETNVSWMKVLLKTGRTHQARLHCLKAGCPVVNDPLYGTLKEGGFFGLHARSLSLRHPVTGDPVEWVAEPPDQWQAVIARAEAAR